MWTLAFSPTNKEDFSNWPKGNMRIRIGVLVKI